MYTLILEQSYVVPFDLPDVPEYFIINDSEEIKRGTKIYPYPSETFSSWTIDGVTDELEQYLQPHFKFPIQIRYQIITGDMPVHIDDGRKFAINYLIAPGGENIATRWWSSEGEILYSEILDVKKWYKLDVSIPHNVEFVTERIAISIKKMSYV